MVINLTVPVSWQQLTQKQLHYVCFLLASGHYDREQVEALCLIRWSKCNELETSPTPEQLAPFLPMMDWLFEIPPVPVRLEKIQGAMATNALLRGMPFEHYLIIENQYQGYIRTKEAQHINKMTQYLYGKPLELDATEAYSVFMWIASVKQLFSQRFPHFFVAAPVGGGKEEGDLGANLRKAMNTQIRALTKGDITKEKEILAMDVWRALTELDAQAEEYEELKKQYSNAK